MARKAEAKAAAAAPPQPTKAEHLARKNAKREAKAAAKDAAARGGVTGASPTGITETRPATGKDQHAAGE